MQTLSEIEEKLLQLELAIENEDIDIIGTINRDIELSFRELVKQNKVESASEVEGVVTRHKKLIAKVLSLKKKSAKQLAQFQHNQKKLKKYRNV